MKSEQQHSKVWDCVPPNWNQLSSLQLIAQPQLRNESTLQLDTNSGELLLQINQGGIRLRSAELRENDRYGLLINEPAALPLQLKTDEDLSLVSAEGLRVEITHEPFALQIYLGDRLVLQTATDGHFVRRHRVPTLTKSDDGWLMSFALNSGEAIYGLGEKWSALDKRGQLIHSYNHDALGVNAEYSYKNVPFCWSGEGWGLFWHTPAPVTHAVGYAPWSQRSYCAQLQDQVLDLFIFVVDSGLPDSNPGAEILSSYTNLTGRAPMPPKWSSGVILSRAYYKNAEEILSVAKEVRRRKMPCDVITFDGRAWQDTDTRFAFEWDAKRYSDPEAVIKELKKLNFKICVWEYPLISVNHPWFKEFEEKGWLLKDAGSGRAYEHIWDRQAFDEVLTPLPNSGLVDFTHPDAYEFWREAHRPLFELGVDMIKADFGEQVDACVVAHNGASGTELHNVYAHLYNRCVFEAAEKYAGNGAFLFSRSGWTGSQRFNSQWGGDPQADWEGMIGNIRGGLSWGLSGAPFYATDVGGFYKDTHDDELYVRWAQAAIFSAHFRLHGIGEREPWTYSMQAETAVMKALRLRYRLQSYIQNTMQQAHLTGLPVQRPMVLAFPQEKQAWAFENQFMFGDDLLVVPCFNLDNEVEFYLPKGHWYPFDPGYDHSFDMLVGETVYRKNLALDEMAVFAKSGTRIPLDPAAEYTDQNENSELVTKDWIATSTN